ncbi:NifU family protein [Sphingomonas sp. CL5.1]|uniref:NifU family protein n=1 Tax=Sphingomonas sp. CL5.1 TaxID=2653203 RepID=UPI0015822F2E|nr:NifU family protein [Sphingomonas sp. CL5.1]QKS00533.1 NifU family protein [Sphingomonas sp. CL5.1]
MNPIEFEPTPNPDALRILPGRRVSHGQPRQFTRTSPVADPLAAELLAIDGIERVLIGADFVTVVREDASRTWDSLRPEIVLALSDALDRDLPPEPPTVPAESLPLGEIEQQIEVVLDRWVRPLLAADGGEAVFVRFDPTDGTVWIRMEGACGGCPSGSITLKRGIEQAIRRWVPEVTRVLPVEAERARENDPKARFRQWIAGKWGSR